MSISVLTGILHGSPYGKHSRKLQRIRFSHSTGKKQIGIFPGKQTDRTSDDLVFITNDKNLSAMG